MKVEPETASYPLGAYTACRITVLNANKKVGIAQYLEARDAREIIGDVCSLSFQAIASGTTINTLKAVILSWTGTEDSLTSDVVSAWNGDGVTPTWAANWTAENTPVALPINSTGLQTFTIENIAIDTASTKNVCVFIWSDDKVVTANEFFAIGDVCLVPGPTAREMLRRSVKEEQAIMSRQYYALYPGVATTGIGTGLAVSTTQVDIAIPFPEPMRVAPSRSVSAAGDFSVTNSGGGQITVTSLATVSGLAISTFRDYIRFVVASGLTAGDASNLQATASTAAIKYDARL